MWVNFRTSQRKQTLEQLALRPSRFQHAQLFHTCLSSMSFGCLVWQHTWDSRWTRDADCWFTSSTAQGGGGSFKNRKPIGEVGCCEFPKVVRHWGVLYMLTSKCALRHNGVHFFDISTSKSGPRMVCFVHFDFEMCFAPQRRALSRHINFQKWSDTEVLCAFWLGNVLRAATACTFSSLIWPAGSAPAALASLLFDPPEPRLSYLFAHLHLLSSDSFSSNLSLLSLPLPRSAFHLSILSEVWLLNFLCSVV